MLLLLALAFQEPVAIPDGMLQPALAVAQSRQLAEEAQQAWDAGQTKAALEFFRSAAELRPMHGGLLLQQARAAAYTGEKEEALTALRRAAAMGFAFELGEDEALASLRDDDAFVKLLAQMETNAAPLVRSEVAFRASLPEELYLYAEGIAHDPKTGDFYLSSFGYCQIARVHQVGEEWVTESFSTLKPWMTFGCYGMVWHDDHLHVATGGAYGKRRVRNPRHLTLDREATIEHNQEIAGALLGDLAMTGDGCDCVLTDPLNNLVLFDPERRGPPWGDRWSAEPRVLIPSGVLPNPQGIVCFAGEEPLIVLADYSAGIFAFPLDEPEKLRALKAPADACLLGIDGLARYGDDLIAIQNGIGVHRVLRFCLDERRERITKVVVLERAHPEYGEPTLGVVVGNDFYYVANAPWGLTADDVPPPAVVLRLPLDG
ncbi:MAG: hypothetical protein O3A20_00220 [Planctomycetota bacterium]|nr:hypothetical protein [Planctomycetota bacterium]